MELELQDRELDKKRIQEVLDETLFCTASNVLQSELTLRFASQLEQELELAAESTTTAGADAELQLAKKRIQEVFDVDMLNRRGESIL